MVVTEQDRERYRKILRNKGMTDPIAIEDKIDEVLDQKKQEKFKEKQIEQTHLKMNSIKEEPKTIEGDQTLYLEQAKYKTLKQLNAHLTSKKKEPLGDLGDLVATNPQVRKAFQNNYLKISKQGGLKGYEWKKQKNDEYSFLKTSGNFIKDVGAGLAAGIPKTVGNTVKTVAGLGRRLDEGVDNILDATTPYTKLTPEQREEQYKQDDEFLRNSGIDGAKLTNYLANALGEKGFNKGTVEFASELTPYVAMLFNPGGKAMEKGGNLVKNSVKNSKKIEGFVKKIPGLVKKFGGSFVKNVVKDTGAGLIDYEITESLSKGKLDTDIERLKKEGFSAAAVGMLLRGGTGLIKGISKLGKETRNTLKNMDVKEFKAMSEKYANWTEDASGDTILKSIEKDINKSNKILNNKSYKAGQKASNIAKGYKNDIVSNDFDFEKVLNEEIGRPYTKQLPNGKTKIVKNKDIIFNSKAPQNSVIEQAIEQYKGLGKNPTTIQMENSVKNLNKILDGAYDPVTSKKMTGAGITKVKELRNYLSDKLKNKLGTSYSKAKEIQHNILSKQKAIKNNLGNLDKTKAKTFIGKLLNSKNETSAAKELSNFIKKETGVDLMKQAKEIKAIETIGGIRNGLSDAFDHPSFSNLFGGLFDVIRKPFTKIDASKTLKNGFLNKVEGGLKSLFRRGVGETFNEDNKK